MLHFCSRMAGFSLRLSAVFFGTWQNGVQVERPGASSASESELSDGSCLGFQAELQFAPRECSVAVLFGGGPHTLCDGRLPTFCNMARRSRRPRECSVAVLCEARPPTFCNMADWKPNLKRSTYDEPKNAVYTHMCLSRWGKFSNFQGLAARQPRQLLTCARQHAPILQSNCCVVSSTLLQRQVASHAL